MRGKLRGGCECREREEQGRDPNYENGADKFVHDFSGNAGCHCATRGYSQANAAKKEQSLTRGETILRPLSLSLCHPAQSQRFACERLAE
jgi:hypothetical protein